MTLLSAGVQIREIDLTTIVPAVSTTEGAIAGGFVWGPVNQRVLISDENELAGTFGKPNNTVANDFFTAANFLAYANKLWVVRVVDEENANTANRATNAVAANNTSGFLIRNDDEYELNYSNGELISNNTGPWVAKYAGALGNSLKVSVCASANTYESTLSGTVAVSANSNVVTGSGTAFTTSVSVGDILVLGGEEHKVSSIANATSLTLATKHLSGASAITAKRKWEYYYSVDVAPGTSDYVSSLGGSGDEMHIVIVDEDGLWTGQKNTVLEVKQGVSKCSSAKAFDGTTIYYKNVINQSKYIRWATHLSGLTNIGSSNPAQTFGGNNKAINYSLQGGKDGSAVGNAQKIRGYGLFTNKEELDVSFVLGSDATQTTSIWIINNLLEKRKDCVGFFSVPRTVAVNNSGDEALDAVAYRNLLPSTSYAALDCGWKYQYDKYNDIYRWVPNNGDIAGLHAQTDDTNDPWYAAAGLNRGHVKNAVKLSWNPSEAERDILYKNGINPVVTFRGEGPVLWGQKTLQAKPSAFDRINVRRLFIVLEKAIEKAARYTLFEFNDEFTRAQFRNMVEPFLRDVKGRRGIYDFRVVCDTTNNTPEVIDRNEFIGDIYIKPARTAEFITLNFVAVRTGVEFNEIVGKF